MHAFSFIAALGVTLVGATSVPPNNANYLGCFADDKDDRVLSDMTSSRDMTAEKCATYCDKSSRNRYYATQYGEECWCGTEADTRHGEGRCDYACSGDSHTTCGGYDAFDLFKMEGDPPPSAPTEVYYLGCFADDKDDRVLGHKISSSDMTLEVCEDHCMSRDKPFVALQYGQECWCGGCELSEDGRDQYDRHGAASCKDYPCSGDTTRQCGGYDAFSLYYVGGCGQPVEKCPKDHECPPDTTPIDPAPECATASCSDDECCESGKRAHLSTCVRLGRIM
eukprot:g20527.t1